ncbi:LysR family transcriptional regulator [Crateriforma conspicua]|uniref:HTH-type transcriptional regulator CynR n=1 Tax=Crateriforma conspicua TaxID=2527996 RepID=A0A5C5Y5E2_9PLAN|nr:LysR family transcriptional regulator [Crateriforma conspicua]QDV65043.1 HTH-type transcriptional regulator CynR [Crateriforma conspicua]TWT70440.1 HTH-type transcriptional regulator CynR [Crateriforma conspicua]
MQLRSLEIFCAVAEHRSFSRAASAFELTQSAVSQSIQQLEESVGAKLIDRGTRPLSLTDAGELYFRGLRRFLRDYQSLEREVRHRGQRLAGEVRVGTIYSVGLSYLPDATTEFSRLHSDVRVQLEFGHSHSVVEIVERGDADFGLVSFPRNTKTIVHVGWQSEPMRLVCSPRHPLADSDSVGRDQLHGLSMVGFCRSLLLRQEIDKLLAKMGVTVNFDIEFDNADSMVRAIEANGGIAFLPQSVVRRETATGTLRVLACPDFQMNRPLGFIFRRTAKLTPAAIEFASLLLGRPLPIDRRGRLDPSPRGGSSPRLTGGNESADEHTATTSVVA